MSTYSKISEERTIQIIVDLLKKNGIRKVIASPGATEAYLVTCFQYDPWFEVYSEVDERSAAYIATGMAAEAKEPVVIACTGATSSRNYMPGLTEAFYRKLPVLAITCSRSNASIGHYINQVTDRTQLPSDIVNVSVQAQPVRCAEDEWDVTIKINKALLALKQNGGGPAHINLQTLVNFEFTSGEISPVRHIERYTMSDELPTISGRVGIFVGAHEAWDEELTKWVDLFCAQYNACVLCDHTSNYRGKHRVLFPLVTEQIDSFANYFSLDILIHIGYVSNCVFSAKSIWRVNPDGELRDPFKKLKAVFQMEEIEFFKSYSSENSNINECTLVDECNLVYKSLLDNMPELPLSNLYVAKILSSKMPENSVLHLGIRNSIRSWNVFETPESTLEYCNTGGFGIDGGVSSLVGASFVHPEKLYFGVFGDLLFFYNLNIIGNRAIKPNVRILLINNGLGQEFKNSSFYMGMFGEGANEFIAAEGHFGRKSKTFVKGMAESLGFEYLSASTKEEFNAVYERFIKPEMTDKPMIFEVFTKTEEESEAFDMVFALTKKGQFIRNVKGFFMKPEYATIRKYLKKFV